MDDYFPKKMECTHQGKVEVLSGKYGGAGLKTYWYIISMMPFGSLAPWSTLGRLGPLAPLAPWSHLGRLGPLGPTGSLAPWSPHEPLGPHGAYY